jgi:pterin-4a-carbinolamine dehydratase
MTGRITAKQFEESDGTRDWRALARGVSTLYRTGSHSAGAELLGRVARLADAANHHPDVDLRPDGVVVRLFTHDAMGLTGRDLALARQISDAAADLGLRSDPTGVQEVDLAIDTLDPATTMPFWAAALGYRQEGDEDLIDPSWRWPFVWFQGMDAPRPLRNRIHLDVFVPRQVREARQAAALAAGGRIASDAFAPQWWTLADPEGNEVDLESWDVFPAELAAPYLTPEEFRAAEGVEDWQFLQGVSASYRTDGFDGGAGLAAAVADLADAAGLRARVDVRYPGVTVRLAPPEDGWMDDRYLDLARRIQAAARERAFVADPTAVQDVQLTLDALDVGAIQTFWAAALAYEKRDGRDLFDPLLRGPSVFIQQLDAPRAQRNRIHVDVFVPHDAAERRVAAVLAAGGRLVNDEHAPFWWTLADPEGNEVDVAVTTGRDEARSRAAEA